MTRLYTGLKGVPILGPVQARFGVPWRPKVKFICTNQSIIQLDTGNLPAWGCMMCSFNFVWWQRTAWSYVARNLEASKKLATSSLHGEGVACHWEQHTMCQEAEEPFNWSYTKAVATHWCKTWLLQSIAQLKVTKLRNNYYSNQELRCKVQIVRQLQKVLPCVKKKVKNDKQQVGVDALAVQFHLMTFARGNLNEKG